MKVINSTAVNILLLILHSLIGSCVLVLTSTKTNFKGVSIFEFEKAQQEVLKEFKSHQGIQPTNSFRFKYSSKKASRNKISSLLAKLASSNNHEDSELNFLQTSSISKSLAQTKNYDILSKVGQTLSTTNTKQTPEKSSSETQNSKLSAGILTKLISNKVIKILNDVDTEGTIQTPTFLENWLQVRHPDFANPNIFPTIPTKNGNASIKTNSDFFMVNQSFFAFKKGLPPSKLYMWARLCREFIYFSNDHENLNIITSIDLRQVNDVNGVKSMYTDENVCIELDSRINGKWLLCAEDKPTRDLWVCELRKIVYNMDSKICLKRANQQKVTVHEPLIFIPEENRSCNENWNYAKNGADWECMCKEGRLQAPIDLPRKEECEATEVRPMWQYNIALYETSHFTVDMLNVKNEPVNVNYLDNAIKIVANQLGRLITIDGTEYEAEEVIFHTPSEHTLQGKRYDLEIQIVHYGSTKGDIAKQATLSFLFEKRAGVYNRFIDEINFTNLPNPLFPKKQLNSSVNLNLILQSISDTADLKQMKPFSFYTYSGSLTAPPCSENTVVYVKAIPLLLSTTVVDLFREALRAPDVQDSSGNIYIEREEKSSNRGLQKRNERAIFYFECGTLCVEDPRTPEVGHYEKVTKSITQYFYVNGMEPSGLPSTFVVSEEEAKGTEGLLAGKK